MKAVVKATGKIVDVKPQGYRGVEVIMYHHDFKEFFKPEELIFDITSVTKFKDDIDKWLWENFKIIQSEKYSENLQYIAARKVAEKLWRKEL